MNKKSEKGGKNSPPLLFQAKSGNIIFKMGNGDGIYWPTPIHESVILEYPEILFIPWVGLLQLDMISICDTICL